MRSPFGAKGFGFPFSMSKLGHLERANGRDKIEANMNYILLSRKGDRPMVPNFGARISSYLFRDLDGPNKVLLEQNIQEALIEFEPRATIREVEITYRDGEHSVRIGYALVGSEDYQDANFDLELPE